MVNSFRLKIIRLNIHGKLYHIIRTPNGDNNIQDNFKNIVDENDYCFEHYDENNKIDLNVLLSKQPQKHTFIFIKEKLRCAKTLCKTYLGIFYERYTKSPNDSTIIQGGLGRLTGYDDNEFSLPFHFLYSFLSSLHLVCLLAEKGKPSKFKISKSLMIDVFIMNWSLISSISVGETIKAVIEHSIDKSKDLHAPIKQESKKIRVI